MPSKTAHLAMLCNVLISRPSSTAINTQTQSLVVSEKLKTTWMLLIFSSEKNKPSFTVYVLFTQFEAKLQLSYFTSMTSEVERALLDIN